MAQSPPVTGLQIRPPTPLERRAWRMLLPEVATAADPCRVLVALMPWDEADRDDVSPSSSAAPPPASPPPPPPPLRVVGAIAATEHNVLIPRRGPRVLLHVISPFRRRGIGRALVEAAARRGRAAGAEALLAWWPVEPDSRAAAAWRALGFTGRADAVVHAIDGKETEAALRPLVERLGARVPADARVVPLADTTDAQRDRIADLHASHMGGTRREIRERLTPTNAEQPPWFWPGSPVLLLGEQVVGFSLGRPRPEPGVMSIEASVVNPDHRHGWANVLLKYEQARMGLAAGYTTAYMQTFEHHADTRKFANRLGDHVVRRLMSLYLTLDAG